MKLFKCEFGSNAYDPQRNLIPRGANYALLGISKDRMLNAYSREAYPSNFFEALEFGYDSADTLRHEKLSFPSYNLEFLANLLKSKKAVQDFKYLGHATKVSKGDSYFIPAQGSTVACAFCDPSYAIMVVAIFNQTLFPDGGDSTHWGLEVFTNTSSDRFPAAGTSRVLAKKIQAKAKLDAGISVIACGSSYSIAHTSDTFNFGGDRARSLCVQQIADVIKAAFECYKDTYTVKPGGLIEKPFLNWEYTDKAVKEADFWAQIDTDFLFRK